jgi:hypothetical protein
MTRVSWRHARAIRSSIRYAGWWWHAAHSPYSPVNLTDRSLETLLEATNVTETKYVGRYLPLHHSVVISTLPPCGVSLQNPWYKVSVYQNVSAERCADRSGATHTSLKQLSADAVTVSSQNQSPGVLGEGLARTASEAKGKAQKRVSLIFQVKAWVN